MNFGVYGILILFGAFVLLLILNPNLSCFGKRIRSPLYPLFRKKHQQKHRKVKTMDYGFDLGGKKSESALRPAPRPDHRKVAAAEDYGFKLTDEKPGDASARSQRMKDKDSDGESG